MHYIDRAIEYQKCLDAKGISAYQYSKMLNKNPTAIGNYTRLLRLSDIVLNYIKNYGINFNDSRKLLRLNKKKSDKTIIKVIRFIRHKGLRGYDIDKLIDYELRRDRR